MKILYKGDDIQTNYSDSDSDSEIEEREVNDDAVANDETQDFLEEK